VAAQSYGQNAIRVATGVPSVLYVTAPPGDTHRLFIVRQTGQIQPSSFGEDASGELYICDYASGAVCKIVP
jgi:hypothetical protein